MSNSSKAVVKTAEMLAQFDEQQTAKLVSSTIAFVESEDSSEQAVATFASIIGLKPTYARYEMGRILFVETLQGQGLSQNAIEQRSSRFFRKLGIDKPASDNPEAIRKAQARLENKAKQRAQFENQSNEALQSKIQTLLAKPTLATLKEVASLTKEIEARKKDEDKGNEEAHKELLKNITEHIKSLSYAELQSFAIYKLDWTI
jgi:hypothetical protein